MNNFFLTVFIVIFMAGFVILVITIARRSLKKYLSSFVGKGKPNPARTEEIQRLIDEHRED